MTTVIECPSCQCHLRLPETLMGKQVRCPRCATTFQATSEGNATPFASGVSEPAEASANGVLFPPPKGVPTVEPQAQLPPAPASLPPVLMNRKTSEQKAPADHAGQPYSLPKETIPQPREQDQWCGLDQDEVMREWEHPGAVRRDCEPHRGGLILTLGVIGLVGALIHVFCLVGLPLSIIAWVLGRSDLQHMQAGLRDPTGETNTRAGMVCGIIGTVFGFLWVLLSVLIFLPMLLD